MLLNIIFSSYLEHEPVFNIEHYFFLVPVVPNKGVNGVAMGHPSYQTRVRRERNDRVSLDAAGDKSIMIIATVKINSFTSGAS